MVADISRILTAVRNEYQLPEDVFLGPRREQRIVRARQVAMFFLRHISDLSYSEIGMEMGGYHRTTVMNNCDRVVVLYETNRGFRHRVYALWKRLEPNRAFPKPELLLSRWAA